MITKRVYTPEQKRAATERTKRWREKNPEWARKLYREAARRRRALDFPVSAAREYVDDREIFLKYHKRRVKDILVVVDQSPNVYPEGTFDLVFVTAGDPGAWTEKVKSGGTIAGDCRTPEWEGVAQYGEVWVKKL